jgi:hypothetical protein
MPTARAALAAVTGPDGRVYAIGGSPSPIGVGGYSLESVRALRTVEAYNPRTDTWATLPGLNVPRYDLAAVLAPDGAIYTIGGSTAGGKVSSVVERFKVPANAASN